MCLLVYKKMINIINHLLGFGDSLRRTITGTIIDVLHSPHPYPNDVLDPALHIAVKKIEEKHILNTFYIFSTFISINLKFFCKRFIFCICVEEIHFAIQHWTLQI